MNQVKPFSYPVESSYQLYLYFCILYFTQLLVVATLTFPLLATRPSHRPLACGQNQGGPQDTPSCFAAPRAHGQSFGVCVCVRVCVYVCFCVYVWGGRHSFNRYIIIISIVKLVNIIKAGDICSGTSVNIVKVMSNVKQVNFVNKKNLEILKKREESASVPTSHTNTFMVFVKLGACCFSDSWKFMS